VINIFYRENHWFKLVDHQPVPVDNLLEWAQWFETADRSVAKTTIQNIDISTVFLGIDHGYGPGNPFDPPGTKYQPMLFETMIFGGQCDNEQWRYSTWDQATKGHQNAVNLVATSLK
jgi:hypothetical protein